MNPVLFSGFFVKKVSQQSYSMIIATAGCDEDSCLFNWESSYLRNNSSGRPHGRLQDVKKTFA